VSDLPFPSITGPNEVQLVNITEHELTVKHLDARILAEFEKSKNSWDECVWVNLRGELAIKVAGDAGAYIKRRYGPLIAATVIYALSRPGKAVPSFSVYDYADEVLADIRKCAAEDPILPELQCGQNNNQTSRI
jgi:hypothetical protein